MAKKTARTAKAAKPAKGDRWTVRGVPMHLQRAAGDMARARGVTLGQWLSEVLANALPEGTQTPTLAAERWEQAIERRLARLETLVLREGSAEPDVAAAAADRANEPAAA